MSARAAPFAWRAALCRYQIWVAAAFIFSATWAAQEFLDAHLHSPGDGFGPGYLHFLRKLDHFFVFVGGGLFMAGRGRLARCAFPFACAGVVLLGWLVWEWDWPWATNSMWLLLFIVAAILGWTHLRPLPAAVVLALLAWLLLCHLDSGCEFGAGPQPKNRAFVAGLALTALLSSALGVVLGGTWTAQRTPLARSVVVLLGFVVAVALAVG